MPTKNEIKHIERVFQKPISEIDEIDIPTYIRQRDEKKMYRFERLAEELKKTLTNN